MADISKGSWEMDALLRREKRDYQKEAISNFNKTVRSLRDMPSLTLSSLPYTEMEIPENSVIYCDPPYDGTKQYKNGGFNHDRFWQWAEMMSESNTVFVSEYSTRSDLFIPNVEPRYKFLSREDK